ncbi:unnamed protein product [Mytilus edulis]|uniref:Uncharacterized protein n=1 Tax=Mytilus edulis TaxID=6550 RepID=A0A8S3V9P6_MYTED|nr:unnamed protein product [Mytilus edulis]
MSTNNMNTKRRVKLPGRFSGEEKWFVVRFDSDQELSSPLQPNQIEDGQSGETGEDKRFQVGDQVEAPWIDGILYPGKIEFESENNEQKKKTEAARKQTAIETAQELFKNSLKEKITALHDVSVSKNLTSVSIINTCTAPSTATNSTLTASSTVTNSTAAPSTVTNSTSSSTVTNSQAQASFMSQSSPAYEPISPPKDTPPSQACPVDASLPAPSSRAFTFPSPYSSYPPFFYPMFGPNKSAYPVFGDFGMIPNMSPGQKINQCMSSEPPPSISDNSTTLLKLNVTPRNEENDFQCSNVESQSMSQCNNNPITTQSDDAEYLESSDKTSLCHKQPQIQLPSCLYYQTMEVFQQKEPSSSPLGNVGKENTDVSNHYMPSSSRESRFTDGHSIFVEAKWLANTQSLFRGKTKPHCLKLVINGFYEPSELRNTTAMMLLKTPVGQALKAYGITSIGMDGTEVVRAINSKIGTMCRAIKENRKSK